MKRIHFMVCLLFGQTVMSALADDRFFPAQVFDKEPEQDQIPADWYSEQLAAMKEPSLWRLSQKDGKATTYRFLYLPSFGRPIAVRLAKSGDLVTLRAVQLDRKLEDRPGKVLLDKHRRLTQTEWEWVQVHLEKTRFWTPPTTAKKNTDHGITLDADEWIFEGVNGGVYHIMDRDEPDDDFKKLCTYLLDLACLSTEWPYFSDHGLAPDDVARYSKRLRTMEEPSLWRIAEKGESQVYRFLWIPSSHRTASVRILRFGELDGREATLEYVELDGDDPGTVAATKTLKLDQVAWENLLRGLERIKFWTLSTKDKEKEPVKATYLLIEGVDQHKYHVIERTEPLPQGLHKLLELVMGLAQVGERK